MDVTGRRWAAPSTPIRPALPARASTGWSNGPWTSSGPCLRRGLGQTGPVPATDDAAGDLPVTGAVVVPAAALGWRFSRSSGPGGQGVNTADSRVELSVRPLELPGLSETQQRRLAQRLGPRLVDGVLTIAASEHRQQLRNRQAAREQIGRAHV